MTARLISSIPELAVTSVAGFSLGPMLLLLSGHFSPWPVITTGLVGAVVAGLLCNVHSAPVDGDRRNPERHAALWTLAAVALVVVWLLVNIGQTAENVYATRDPATYNITARWLMDHPSLHIPTHPEIFGSPPGFVSQSAGFSDDKPGYVYSQGNHLMPALAAVVGWVSGVRGMFRADALLGALALLALFGLARRIVGSPLALLATAAMAVSMPMIYVSRDMYSEPLMMLFLMGSLELLHRAVKYGRRADFLLAGYVAGCSALVRIDSYAALLAVIATATVIVALAAGPRRRAAVANALILVAAGAIPAFIGWLDVSKLSSGYYRDQHHHIVLELLATLGLLAVAPLIVAVLWRPGIRRRLDARRAQVTVGTAALVVAGFVVLVSRPLWFTGHGPVNHTLARWQEIDGVTVDGSRLYSEQTVNWLADFHGWPVVLLAIGGYLLLIRALVRERDYPLVGVLALGLTMSGLYLWNPQITPDLPWAMRRFVPVVLPLLLIAAARAMRALGRRGGLWRGAAALLGVLVVAYPAVATWPMRDVREAVPQYRQVQAICKAVGRTGAVVMTDVDSLAAYGQTMRSYCHVPSMALFDATPVDLQRMNAAVAAHHRTLFVMSRESSRVPFAAGESTAPFSTVLAELWPNVINRVPSQPVTRVIAIFLGTVDNNGYVRRVASSQ